MVRGCQRILLILLSSTIANKRVGLKNTVSRVWQRLDKSVSLLVAVIVALFADILADIQVVLVPFARLCGPTVVAVSV